PIAASRTRMANGSRARSWPRRSSWGTWESLGLRRRKPISRGIRPRVPPGGVAAVGGGSDGLTVGGLAAVGNRFALPGGSRPPDPLAGVATELAALSPLRFGSGKDHGRGLAPPGPRCTGGPQKTLAPLTSKGRTAVPP